MSRLTSICLSSSLDWREKASRLETIRLMRRVSVSVRVRCSPGDPLLFFLPLGDVPADVDELGDLAVFFPDGVDIRLEMAELSPGAAPGPELADRPLVPDHLMKGATLARRVAGLVQPVVDFVTFFSR